ncbi:thioredoxin-dependent thiol peroxidase [Paenibacillus sp. JX-17]|uniref:thioredoxin-dependent peroxiredoxin n=1 Tax=Paenibacillus lacisoli TaxID=3064525 RepID=A0ABT9CG28_9BACL|nr:thioredoxin-dependent thiol peroxidase [Paenibacillus sp. JX-17]MDO7908238.1 thioredoxin-dependent thiol peroxidase [Paenibacillus sp. JX-17]
MVLTLGQLAPDFTLPSSSGDDVQLSQYRGKKILLYFYPKDLTSTCSTQACDFRDRELEFRDLNTVILGVSPDPVSRHHKFIEKYGLPFDLLSDEDHRVSETYGVWQQKQMYGKTYMGIVRSTFLIDEEGKLIREWRGVRVKGHIEEALATVQQLEQAAE